MSGASRWLLPLLLALCVIRLWLMPLPSSFWLDETATLFVAEHGSHHSSLADAAPQAWQSWYYPVIRLEGKGGLAGIARSLSPLRLESFDGPGWW